MNEIYQRLYNTWSKWYYECSERDIKKAEFTGCFQAKRSKGSYLETQEWLNDAFRFFEMS